MKFTVEQHATLRRAPETLVLFAFEGEDRPTGAWESFDASLQRKFASAAKNEDFTGKEKSTLTFYPADVKPAKRIVVAGLGKRDKFGGERLRRAAALAAQRCRSASVANALVILPDATGDARAYAQAVVEGVVLGLYEFKKYKSGPKDKPNGKLEQVRFLAGSAKSARAYAEGTRRGDVLARATCLTRDLVNEPALTCTPRFLAEQARAVTRGTRSVSIKVFDEDQIRRMKMGALLGVAAGSAEPPRFVHLHYRAPGARRTVALVGKAITFDSGGLCIKPADGMLNMKNDMAGAAAVIGIFQALAELRPKVNVHGIFGATENMPGGRAYKTRDVLSAMNGKTMEIINTDAEGRVTLADSLSYAAKLKPDEIIDMATLTGACVVALGPEISGILGTQQDLVNRLASAAREAGEKLWQLPLDEDYWDMIKSDVADMKNSGGRFGGSITAALFLKEFVDKEIPWAHIDIAGPALSDQAGPYKPAGGTGVMVRTILNYLESRES
ncbi:MAG: leucyl aminopeptidase [Planctomycetes bacterium]|nr:leucyl aminopeptidase [Planctomycetota bacterium]